MREQLMALGFKPLMPDNPHKLPLVRIFLCEHKHVKDMRPKMPEHIFVQHINSAVATLYKT